MAQRIALVRAVEETAGGEAVLAPAARVAATRKADGSRDDEGFLAARAAELGAAAETAAWGGDVGAHPGRWRPGVVVAVLLGSLVCGVAADRLGGGREINLLAFPLLGLVAWNLCVYLAGLARALLVRGGVVPRPRLPAVLVDWWQRAADLGGGARSGAADVAAAARARFRELWLPLAAPVTAAGASALLHAAAAVFALGLLAGMYWRGLAFEYAATFESTFLSAEAAQRLLGGVLAPASWLTGIEPPRVVAVAGKADTARWLHLFAVTVGLIVVVPRLALAAAGGLRWRRMGRAVRLAGDWGDYAASCRRAARGGGVVATVFSHGQPIDTKQREAVRRLATGLWGGAVTVEFALPVEYGEEAGAAGLLAALGADGTAGADRPVVVHFGLTATPEAEVQGELLRALKSAAAGEVVLALDAAPFVARFGRGGGHGRRFDERCAVWAALAQRSGVRSFVLSGGGTGAVEEITAASAGSGRGAAV
jgi:hypothetical protein